MEEQANYYFEQLSNTIKPGNTLSTLYGALYGVETGRSEIIMMNRLVQIFGRFTVFFSLMDMAGTYPESVDNPYSMLYTICKKRFEHSHGGVFTPSHNSLMKYAEDMQKEREALIARSKKKGKK